MNRFALFAVISGFLLSQSVAARASLPVSHRIPGITQSTQQNGLLCGPAALQSVLEYFGPEVNQKAIADVARTSSSGTWSFDMVRTGHFSALSAAEGDFFPHEVPVEGFIGRPLGLAAFGHSATSPWLAEAKNLVSKNIPVIMLMSYTPEPDSGGHYRTLVGYNDTLSEAYFIDPWGRSMGKDFNADGTVTWTYDELLSGWSYTEAGLDTPYWGVALIPWSVAISIKGKLQKGATVSLNATVQYPCPAPFNCEEFPATQVQAVIELPEGMRLASGQKSVLLPQLFAGQSTGTSWSIVLDEPPAEKAVSVYGIGLIQGQVPEACGTGNGDCYSPYSYSDVIGGYQTIAF